MTSILKALVAIQSELKAPKDQKAAKYRYRNIEDINEALKPLAAKHECAVVYSDTFTDGVCVSTCRLLGQEDGGIVEVSATGAAYINREPEYMSIEQASGAASSFARKYAACGLFAIDSSEHDPDRVNAKPKQEKAKQSSGRFDQIKKLKQEALDLGITEEGMRGALDNVLDGKALSEASATDIKACEGCLQTLIADKKQLTETL